MDESDYERFDPCALRAGCNGHVSSLASDEQVHDEVICTLQALVQRASIESGGQLGQNWRVHPMNRSVSGCAPAAEGLIPQKLDSLLDGVAWALTAVRRTAC